MGVLLGACLSWARIVFSAASYLKRQDLLDFDTKLTEQM
jgi:hypothetical protein